MSRKSAGVALAGLSSVMLLAGAAAALPPAMDRVPTGAALSVSVPKLAKVKAGVELLQKTFGLDLNEGPLADLMKALAMPGLNLEGSLAMALVPGPEGLDFSDESPPMVLIVPVIDYAQFVGGMGGDPKAAVAEVRVGEAEEPGFARNLGGGFAAVAPTREMLERFRGEPGQNGGHERLLGANGRAVADSSDVTVIANLPSLEPKVRESMEGFRAQVEMMGAMAGQNMAANLALIDAVVGGVLRDGQAGVMGFGVTEAGLKGDFAAQFKEGSPSAKYFAAKGDAGALLGRVPNQPILFALAMDTSAPGIKQAFKDMLDLTRKADPAAAEAMGMSGTMIKSMERMDGMVIQMGATPALMGGLLLNTMAYMKTSDAPGYAAALRETFTALNGKQVQGFTYQTSYTPAAREVGGVKVDEWSMRMQADPNDPNAQQVQAMQMGFFGMEGGPSGFLAPAEGGLVMTYSKNSALLEQGLAAARGGAGLGGDPGVKAVSAMLIPDRSVEGYVGIRSILESVMGLMAMMGGGPVNLQIPPDLPPIGLGGTTNHGGARVAVFVPTPVLETFKKLAEQMGGRGEGDLAPPEKAGQPRFE